MMSSAQSSLRRFMQTYAHWPDFVSLRLVEQQSRTLAMTRNVIEPPSLRTEMVCVHVDGQQGSANIVTHAGFMDEARRVADQALQLLLAPIPRKARGMCCLNYSDV